jgi:hypothetical protein
MNNLLNYKLIGIGEFSHGILESWIFRFNMLKYTMKHTNKKIIIFNEMSIWQANNIMNNTIWSNQEKKFIKYDGIKFEEPVQNDNYVGGKLWQYCHHVVESNIFLKIIKYIRKHIDRITLIGIDNDKIDRDYDMYKIIMKNYNKNNINFLWAHNDHIADLPLSKDNLDYIENKNHKWFLGHYLKRKLKDDYCIVLSQAYEGTNRFNGYCIGENCIKRTWQLKYFYKKFKYDKNKKYVNKNKTYQLLLEYDEPLVSFSNSYYKRNKYGVQDYIGVKIFNYVLFWNKVNSLDRIK